MNTRFSNILVPIDFSVNSEIAINKALELAEGDHAVIHLFHLISHINYITADPTFIYTDFQYQCNREQVAKKMNELAELIKLTKPGVSISIHIKEGTTITEHIASITKNIKPELIVIGKHNYHKWFTFFNSVEPGKLAKLTNCPVLTVKKGSLMNPVKTIVVPVRTFVPARKIELLKTIAGHSRVKVFLVMLGSGLDENAYPSYDVFLDTFRLVKAGFRGVIEHRVLAGANIARAALLFAQSVKADLLLLNPETETRLSSFTSQRVTDFIRGDSKLEVLTVSPYMTAYEFNN